MKRLEIWAFSKVVRIISTRARFASNIINLVCSRSSSRFSNLSGQFWGTVEILVIFRLLISDLGIFSLLKISHNDMKIAFWWWWIEEYSSRNHRKNTLRSYIQLGFLPCHRKLLTVFNLSSAECKNYDLVEIKVANWLLHISWKSFSK